MLKARNKLMTAAYRLSKISKKPLYNVVLVNDNYTPMDFVVGVLEKYFYKRHQQALQLMLRIHKQGRAVCGTYNRQIAETKVAMVMEYARYYQYPLLCIMEKAPI